VHENENEQDVKRCLGVDSLLVEACASGGESCAWLVRWMVVMMEVERQRDEGR
jgi:hypothetical protein